MLTEGLQHKKRKTKNVICNICRHFFLAYANKKRSLFAHNTYAQHGKSKTKRDKCFCHKPYCVKKRGKL